MACFAVLTGCAGPGSGVGSQSSGTVESSPDAGAAEGTAEGGDPGDSEADDESEPSIVEELTEEQMLEVLLSSADLPVDPQGHSTHSGISYFEENLAVEHSVYEQTFGGNECAESMTRFNIDLIGEGAESGLLHRYELPADGVHPAPEVFLWVLSYPDEVDSSTVWEPLYRNCSGIQLEAQADYVEIDRYLTQDQDPPFGGITMRIHSENSESGSYDVIEGHSVTADFGHNLVVMSTLGVDVEMFEELLDLQGEKLADFQSALEES